MYILAHLYKYTWPLSSLPPSLSQIHASEEDRAKLWQEVWSCRKALAVEHRMLQEPPETGNFLTTTLRRWASTLTPSHPHTLTPSPFTQQHQTICFYTTI